MFEIIVIGICLVVSFGAGLLVGRRNPSIASALAKVANQAKTEVGKVV